MQNHRYLRSTCEKEFKMSHRMKDQARIYFSLTDRSSDKFKGSKKAPPARSAGMGDKLSFCML
jgi:hypothetical protein